MSTQSNILQNIKSSNILTNSLPYIKGGFKQQKTREITTLILTLIAVSLLGIFAISPTLSTIAELNKELSDSRDTNARLATKIKNLGLLQQQYAAIQSDVPIIFNAVPKTPNGAYLMGQLKVLASANGTTLTRSQIYQVDLPKEVSSSKLITKKGVGFAYSITVEGSYDNVVKFMGDLTNFDRIITIDNIAITSGPPGSNTVQLNIRGKTYFKQE